MEFANRLMIVTYALEQAAAGAHYLKGARGAAPGFTDGLGRSVRLVEKKPMKDITIHTGANSLQTCYGRWGAVGGYLFQVGSDDLKDLEQYVADNQSLDVNSWPHFQKPGLFPRRLHGAGSSIALGEDCRNKRHFDCIGFIYWVLHQVLPQHGWQNHNISHYENGFKQVEPVGLLDPADLRNGDIVTRTNTEPNHIGIGTGYGGVIDASIENLGVRAYPYKKTSWTGVSRIKEQYL